jgi:galactose mutarotase-like enzyme
MIIHSLASQDLSVSVLPESGGAITDGVFQGHSFLAKPPYPLIAPKFLGQEHDWLAAWNGGWQPLLPNAGGQYLHGKYPQGFHGNASQAAWKVLEKSSHSISLDWSEENLQSQRSIKINENAITLNGSLVNRERQARPVIVTEHLILGSDFLKSNVTLEPVGNAQFRELAYDGSAKGAAFAPWESFQDSNWSIVSSQTPARMGVFSGISCIRVLNENYEIEISWDVTNLPYLWIWEEMAYTQEHPWNGEYLALGIEPSSAADGVGLGGSSVRTLAADEKLEWSVQLKIQKRVRT